MIRVFALLFDATTTWEKIDQEQQSILRVFLSYLLPILLISVAAEAFLLMRFGQQVGPMDQLVAVSPPVMIRYELARLVFALFITFGGALLVRKLGDSFHSRHQYRNCFVTLAYSLGPLFLMQIVDGWPVINSWIVWATGILLSVSILYKGIPRTLRPEPSNALGLYLFLSVFLIIASGLAHYVATLILEERILS